MVTCKQKHFGELSLNCTKCFHTALLSPDLKVFNSITLNLFAKWWNCLKQSLTKGTKVRKPCWNRETFQHLNLSLHFYINLCLHTKLTSNFSLFFLFFVFRLWACIIFVFAIKCWVVALLPIFDSEDCPSVRNNRLTSEFEANLASWDVIYRKCVPLALEWVTWIEMHLLTLV